MRASPAGTCITALYVVTVSSKAYVLRGAYGRCAHVWCIRTFCGVGVCASPVKACIAAFCRASWRSRTACVAAPSIDSSDRQACSRTRRPWRARSPFSLARSLRARRDGVHTCVAHALRRQYMRTAVYARRARAEQFHARTYVASGRDVHAVELDQLDRSLSPIDSTVGRTSWLIERGRDGHRPWRYIHLLACSPIDAAHVRTGGAHARYACAGQLGASFMAARGRPRRGRRACVASGLAYICVGLDPAVTDRPPCAGH
jgi:hypothetical protein